MREIKAVGKKIKLFQPGDEVVARTVKSSLKKRTGT
jgi:NADPH:quinone reductase-like Zn-dependent oxidoreductase